MRRGAEEDEREKRDRLIVAAGRATTNDRDDDGRDDQPQRNENRRREVSGGRGHERREHHERDAENGDGVPRSWIRAHAHNILHLGHFIADNYTGHLGDQTMDRAELEQYVKISSIRLH